MIGTTSCGPAMVAISGSTLLVSMLKSPPDRLAPPWWRPRGASCPGVKEFQGQALISGVDLNSGRPLNSTSTRIFNSLSSLNNDAHSTRCKTFVFLTPGNGFVFRDSFWTPGQPLDRSWTPGQVQNSWIATRFCLFCEMLHVSGPYVFHLTK